jgi:hypothetical protein
MTNSRSLSWIDRGRWAGLLAKVTDDPLPAARPAHARPPSRPVPATAVPPTLPPPPPAKVVLSYRPFSSSSNNLEERLQALVAWIEACVPCRAAFIADDNGLPVVEHLGAEAGQIAVRRRSC